MIVAFVYNSNNVNFENYADDGQTIIPVNAPFSNLYIYIYLDTKSFYVLMDFYLEKNSNYNLNTKNGSSIKKCAEIRFILRER